MFLAGLHRNTMRTVIQGTGQGIEINSIYLMIINPVETLCENRSRPMVQVTFLETDLFSEDLGSIFGFDYGGF